MAANDPTIRLVRMLNDRIAHYAYRDLRGDPQSPSTEYKKGVHDGYGMLARELAGCFVDCLKDPDGMPERSNGADLVARRLSLALWRREAKDVDAMIELARALHYGLRCIEAIAKKGESVEVIQNAVALVFDHAALTETLNADPVVPGYVHVTDAVDGTEYVVRIHRVDTTPYGLCVFPEPKDMSDAIGTMQSAAVKRVTDEALNSGDGSYRP